MKKLITCLTLLIISCSDDNSQFVYYGRLDADIIRLSAEVGGEIDSMLADEGMVVKKDQLLAVINTEKLKAQRDQQMAQMMEIESAQKALAARIQQVNAQLLLAKQNLQRTKNMFSEGAATEYQHDEIKTQVEVLSAQLKANQRNLEGMEYKKQQLQAALRITALTLEDSRVTSALDGIVLNRFHFEHEQVGPGTPLFEVADLTNMEAKIYVPLNDLTRVKLGQKVEVKIDGLDSALEGTVRWISSESEFTPKTILTEETRTTLVYMVKVTVPNSSGALKIGMPVDIRI